MSIFFCLVCFFLKNIIISIFEFEFFYCFVATFLASCRTAPSARRGDCLPIDMALVMNPYKTIVSTTTTSLLPSSLSKNKSINPMKDRDTTTIVSPYFRLIVWICAQQTGLPSRYDEGERKKIPKKWLVGLVGLDTCDIFLGIDIFSITDVLYCLFFSGQPDLGGCIH